jgi:hypothetical protein
MTSDRVDLAATRGRFIASVYGTPNPKMSREEYEAIIAEAEANGQNVFFGDAWKYPPQTYETAPERRVDLAVSLILGFFMVGCFVLVFLGN